MVMNQFNDRKQLIVNILLIIFMVNGIFGILCNNSICRNFMVYIGVMIIILYTVLFYRRKSIWNITFFDLGILVAIFGYFFENVIVMNIALGFLLLSHDDKTY